MRRKRIIYRLLLLSAWLLCVLVGLMVLTLLIDLLRDGNVMAASIYPPNAHWKFALASAPWIVGSLAFLLLIKRPALRRWFESEA